MRLLSGMVQPDFHHFYMRRAKEQIGNAIMIRTVACTVLVILLLAVPACANPDPDYTLTYTIALNGDGSAQWTVEYRTLLLTQDQITAFERDTEGSSAALSPDDIRQLMEQSAAAASAATGRPMEVRDFSSGSVVQSSPTGSYGVIRYQFVWTGFGAAAENTISVGDVFFGGLYLPKEATLIIRIPDGFSVTAADPQPDQDRGELVWYGLRSFSSGQPRVIMTSAGLPLAVMAGVFGVLIIAATAIVLFVRRKRRKTGDEDTGGAVPEPMAAVSEAELLNVEQRILQLIRDSGGEMFQSEIVQRLGIPKSTVSSALNALHERGVIIKIRKGRENLIRLS